MKKNKLLLILLALLAFGQMAWAQSIVSVNYVDENGVTQPVNAISLDEIAQVNPNGATIGTSGFTNCYVVQGSNVVMNGQLGYYGGINLILCDGAKLTINTTDESAIQSQTGNNQLTIYVQANGTGQLIVNASNNNGLTTEYLTINGGVISVTSGGTGIHADDNLIINRGTVTVNSDGNAMYGYNVTINGGNVSATSTGNAGIANGATGTITLGYTTNNDRIYASSYQVGYTASLIVKDGQYFITDDGQFVYGGYNKDYVGFLAGRTLSPFIPTEWSGGGNSANDPYIITSVYDLNLLSLRARAGEDYTGKYFRLDANITFTHSTEWDDITDPESNFTAISIFDGHFDGNNKTISGLRLHTSNNFVEQKGLFCTLGPNANVENLTLSDARIAGEKQVGAIVGYVQGGAIVTNCHVTGTVTVYAYGNTLEKHGGIVGKNEGTVSNCVSEVTISRSIYYAYGSENVGGIAGYNTGSLLGNKVFNADITAASSYGAIAGLNDGGTLTNNYYRACTVNGTTNATGVGCNGADVTTGDGAMSIHTITKPNDVTINTEPTLVYGGTNYWKYGTTITLNGGLDDTPTAGWQKAYSINDVVISENSTTIKDNFNMPATDVTITIGEIHADWANTPNNPTAGSSSDNPYKIYFTDQLDLLATRVNNDNTNTGYAGKYFKLMNNLEYDTTVQNNYIAIGNWNHQFKGCFDGNNDTISGIRINLDGNNQQTDGYQGIFGSIRNGGSQVSPCEVKNLTIDDADITANTYAGGIVGFFYGGKVTNCHATSTVFVRSASTGVQCHGGIVGTATAIVNAVEISHCTSSATLTNANNNGTGYGAIAGSITNGVSVSDNFAIEATVCSATNNTYGAIVGENYQNNSTLERNYYHNCTVAGEVNTITKGCENANVIASDGAIPVFSVSVPDGVTTSATATVTHNTVNYYKERVPITLTGGLTGETTPGCQKAYVVYGDTLIGSNLAPGHVFNMQNANAVVTVVEVPADWAAEEGAGDTEENPYKIYYTEQLDLLATRVNAGESYSGKYFKLMDNLTYDKTKQSNYTAIGNYNHQFKGCFDGNYKTISGIRINKSGSNTSTDGYQGIFGHIGNGDSQVPPCKVKNLTIDDADITAYDYAGGIVGFFYGGTVTNCHATSTVFIRAVAAGANSHGGIVGEASAYNTAAEISHCTSSATLTNTSVGVTEYGAIVGAIRSGVTMSDNFAIEATVPSCANNDHGAIVGYNNGSTLARNYYHNCTVAGIANVTDKGCANANVDANDGAMPVFTLSLASGISADVDTTLIQGEVNYYKLGTTVALSYTSQPAPGYRHIYSVNGTPIPNYGTSFDINSNSVVTVEENQLIDLEEHQGTENDPYLISNVEQWNQFATRVNGGNTYSGKYFKLMEDISVTTMVGASTTTSDFKYFSGIFDGNGHTLNVTYSSGSSEWRAPFSSIHNATIKNLHVAGSISTTGMRPAGIVSFVNGNSTIENCWSSVAISSSHNVDIDAGGIVSRVNEAQNLTLSGCLFTGSINYSNSDGFEGGGMIGWTQDNASTTLIDCYFAPSSINVKDKGSHYMFVSGKRDYLSLTNCYYNSVAAASHLDPQGNRARTITGGDNVVVAFAGSGNVYDVSGISGYDVGIVYDSVLYAGKSESVQVDLTYTGSIPAHTSPVYTVTNGSLSGITLKLNSDNSSTVTINYDHYETDNWSGTGTEDDPYLIYTEGQWILLADRVSNEDNPNSYSGKYFKLMEDISINENHDTYQNPYPKLVGYGERSFQGTFDGNGHTIVLSYKNKSYQYEQAIALFPSVKNATIKRLTVDGYIYRDVCPHGIAGIVGSSYGTTNLISCRSSVDVQNDGDISPYNANGGGLVAYVESGTLNMINCVFDGRLEGRSHTSTYAHLWGGMINYVRDGATANLINCLFNPEDIKFWDPGATATFARKHDNATVNLTNCYYKNGELGTTQGTSAIGWEAEQLLDALGYAWEYTSPAVFQPIMQPQTFTGEGSEGSPYQIATAEDWDKLATYVAHQDSHSSDHFQMTGDISTTSMVGLFDNLTFKGTFDGGGNTLTVNYEVTSMPDKEISTAAPFAFIENATITDLHTAGSITTAGMRPASVAGFVVGNSSITNCKSEVALSSSYDDDIDAGGFVARVNEDKSVTLTGCLFTGSITYSNETGYEGGGMVGWTQEDASATLTDCVFAPSAINITKFVTNNNDKKHRMFVGGKERGDLTRCYYNGVAAASGMVAEGERVYDIIPGQNVTMQLYGIATDYTVSGISIYGTGDKGLKFDDVFHAVSGNVLDLNLGVTVPYTVTNYLANGEVITFSDTWNNYILTMPEEDVTITATFSDVAWDGEGTEESPYLIYYNVQWDLLGTNVNAGNNYNGVYFKLMDDISVETMVGSTDRPFRGIFDGGGHTLTFNKGTEASPYDQNFCAPFKAVEAATIKNLHTTGAIYTSKQHAAGFVAQLIPNTGNFTRFIGCRSSMKINSTVASDARTGGFIGSCSDAIPDFTHVPERLSIFFEDCLFDGEFSGTATGWGGFVGYYFHCESEGGNSGMVHFTRCLFAPSAMNISTTDAYNFVRSDVLGWSGEEGAWIHAHHSYPEDVMTITKLYYTITCGNLENYLDEEVQPTPVGNMTNVQLRNALGDNWMIVTEDVEKVVPTMGLMVRVIEGYGESTESDHWAFIASPIEGSVTPTDVDNLIGNAIPNTDPVVYDFDLYRFNPLAELEWENYHAHTDGFNLVNGMGYLYATKTTKTLTFSGSFNTDTSKEITDLPAGFNLVGNPFTVDAYVSKPYYKMNNDGSAILADVQSIATPIPPCYGVIVQVDGSETVTFNTSGEFSAGPNNGSLKIALSQANTRSNAVMDNAIVSFNEGVELGKFYFGTQNANIYIPQGGEDYAIAYSEGQGEMPLNFKATENGTYTLTINPEGVEVGYLHLIDNMTGNDIDLLAGASTGSATYTFTAKMTDYESRFKLVFSASADADGDSGTFAFFSNGNWIIANEGKATLQVIDINGRILTNETVNGSVSKAINAAPGVYVIRLINGDDVKVQKIVLN